MRRWDTQADFREWVNELDLEMKGLLAMRCASFETTMPWLNTLYDVRNLEEAVHGQDQAD